MPKGSPNKVIVDTLIATIQQKDAKLYEALSKMAADLNKTYETLFEGPLPAVDGFALFNLNALNLTGIVPEANLPANIAFQDRENTFILNQFFEGEEGSLSLAFNNGTDPIEARFHVGIKEVNDFYIGNNLSYVIGTLERDDDTITFGSIIEFFDDVIQLGNFGLTTAEPVDGEFFYTFSIEGKEIKFANLAQDDEFSVIFIGDDDVVRVGEDCDTTGLAIGHFAIPNKIATELPASGDATCDGVIIINKTTPRLIFYVNGLRYYVAGTAF